MVIKIGQSDITECWDGVFYKKLSQYPQITEWEIQTVLDFISYEASNGRNCEIEAKKEIIDAIEHYRPTYDTLLWFIRDYSATTVNISEKPVVSSISITDSLTL